MMHPSTLFFSRPPLPSLRLIERGDHYTVESLHVPEASDWHDGRLSWKKAINTKKPGIEAIPLFSPDHPCFHRPDPIVLPFATHDSHKNGYDPNQPRNSKGEWTKQGRGHHPAYQEWIKSKGPKLEALQHKYADLLDHLEKEQRENKKKPYDPREKERDPDTGRDPTQDPSLIRPIVVGEISHPEDPHVMVPVIYEEGYQRGNSATGKGSGRIHIEHRHGKELRDFGHNSPLDIIYDTLADARKEDFYNIGHNSRNFVVVQDENINYSNKLPVSVLTFEHAHENKNHREGNNLSGGYYKVHTIFPQQLEELMKNPVYGSSSLAIPSSEIGHKPLEDISPSGVSKRIFRIKKADGTTTTKPLSKDEAATLGLNESDEMHSLYSVPWEDRKLPQLENSIEPTVNDLSPEKFFRNIIKDIPDEKRVKLYRKWQRGNYK
ncbi:hypothetical protein GS501_04675 [Saccharibacter sp. 17.LH.SD]|uniref:hypothetical protein n=1 Tax=Saccharibacter sp. 17.LH.SD TaxID=2689393 RepID=UPI00136D589A|nr:hypothetical protein [Saccharibacter sp. 17.LH.SD]MXV44340.1 hypothetical protein [Saccharibacter sp. 17.LH.SD]